MSSSCGSCMINWESVPARRLFLRLPELWKERVERMENSKKKSRKKKVLIWVLIVLLALAGGGWYAMKRMNDAMQTAASAQNTYTVTRGNVSVTITGSGKLETPDATDVTLPVGVKVDTLFVKEGDSVKAGDVLAALDGDSLQYRAAELSSELAALDQQLGSRKTRSRITAPVEGRVKYQPAAAGDDVIEAVNEYGCLAILSTDGSMEVRLQTDAALSLNDKVTVQWDGGSAEGTLVSRLDGGWLVTFSDEKAPYQETAEVYSGSTLLGSGVMEIHAPLAIFGNGGTISEVSYSVNTRVYAGTALFTLENEPDTDSYRKALSDRNEKAGQLQDMLMLQTSRNVVAPADGTVQLIGVEEGKKTASADGSGDVTAFTLGSGGAVKMTVEVDELDVAKVQVGQSAEVTLDAFSGEKFAAEVSRISRIGKPSGSITVYETDLLLTGDDRLLEGMNGTAVILSERKENVLLIPLGAVHEDENGSYVNRVSADGSTERTAIETGLSDGSNAEVLSGLNEGDEIAYTPASNRRMFGFGPMSGAGFGGEQP